MTRVTVCSVSPGRAALGDSSIILRRHYSGSESFQSHSLQRRVTVGTGMTLCMQVCPDRSALWHLPFVSWELNMLFSLFCGVSLPFPSVELKKWWIVSLSVPVIIIMIIFNARVCVHVYERKS